MPAHRGGGVKWSRERSDVGLADWSDTDTNSGMPAATRSHRGKDLIVLRAPRERMDLPTPWFGPSEMDCRL